MDHVRALANVRVHVATIIHHTLYELSCLTQGDLGDTALIAAVGQGHYEVVDVLLRHGANVNLRNKVR